MRELLESFRAKQPGEEITFEELDAALILGNDDDFEEVVELVFWTKE